MEINPSLLIALFIILAGGALLLGFFGGAPIPVTKPEKIGAMLVKHNATTLNNWDSADKRVEVNKTAANLANSDYDLGFGLIQITAVGGTVKDVEVSVVPKSGNFRIELYSATPEVHENLSNGEPFSVRKGETVPIQYYVTMKKGTWSDGSYYIGVSVSAPETGCSDVVADEEGGTCDYAGQVEVYVYS